MKKNIRLIARLDIKNDFVIKGIHLEGLRKVGNPNELALKYFNEGIDEIVFMDAVASLYGRNNLFHIIEKACENVFVPIAVGGGIRSISDISQSLVSGADKLVINTGALINPQLIKEASRIIGSQSIVISIEAKKKNSFWEAYVDSGREPTGMDVVDWAKQAENLGAGEILLTSVDMDGTKKGFDIELISRVVDVVSIPVIASGGCGSLEHLNNLISTVDIDGIAVASMLHYNINSIREIKNYLSEKNINVRKC
jgi:cyclase